MVLIGIDPGSNTGAALYRDGELRALRTIAPVEIHALILKLVPDVVVFEDSRLQSRVWTGNKLRPGAASKVARDVGRIDAWCDLIEAVCKPLRQWARQKMWPLLRGICKKTSKHCLSLAECQALLTAGTMPEGSAWSAKKAGK